MGGLAPTGRERPDTGVTDVYLTDVRAQNSGVCVEPRHSGVSLHLGSGGCPWPDWINVDLAHADVCSDLRALPFAPASADRIAAIHVLEHFYEWEAVPLLREWGRVLKPGGGLTLELPCMDKVLNYISLCVTKAAPINLAFSWWVFWGDPKHRSPAMTHRWGYSMDSLGKLLESVGFVSVNFERPYYHFAERDMRVTAQKGV